ncbi:MAG TPA: MurT ligase domain-containing protein [Thermoleophilaceae bacterium]|nr:MurT ligase domain-containing protein [Thermoleophilaceae bacterium]
MLRVWRLLARLVRALSRRLGRGGGTTLPGRLLLRVAPDALDRMAADLDDGAAVISATNGKTTTAAMVAAILERSGERIVHNRAGSNMGWGVATALLDARRGHGQLGLFEVDEAWLPQVARSLHPRSYLLANLFRDQLDRYGELESLAEGWAGLVAEQDGSARFVLNADDPLVADLGRGRSGVVYFGVDDDTLAIPELQHAADSKHCRNCGTAYVYDAIYLGHLGRYRCPGCDRSRPAPSVTATRVALDGMAGADVTLRTQDGTIDFRLPLPGLYNVYNAAAAAALALELGASLADVEYALAGFGGAFGRVETIAVPHPAGGERPVSILLIKNPAGANEVLRTLTLADAPIDLWLALNDKIADGRDVSWIWDADFELLAGHVRHVTCTGTRAEELALRLKYAGIDAQTAVDRDLAAALDTAVAAGEPDRPLYALPTYTALLELRDLLSQRGLAERWAG